MKIHPVTHGPAYNRWCGPSALSALTGRTTDETSAVLRELTGRRSITGTSNSEILLALRHYGLSYAWRPVLGRMTLAAWLRADPPVGDQVMLVSAGRHWQVVTARRFVCGKTLEIVGHRHPKVKRRAIVQYVWRIH